MTRRTAAEMRMDRSEIHFETGFAAGRLAVHAELASLRAELARLRQERDAMRAVLSEKKLHDMREHLIDLSYLLDALDDDGPRGVIRGMKHRLNAELPPLKEWVAALAALQDALAVLDGAEGGARKEG